MLPNPKNQSSDLSLDGLEGLLDSGRSADDSGFLSTTSSGAERDQDWSLDETAKALGLSRGAVIRRLEDGILTGYRIKRSYGQVWRVKPTWLAGTPQETAEESSVSFAVQQTNFAVEKSGNQQILLETEARESMIPELDSSAIDNVESANQQQDEYLEVFDAGEESTSLTEGPGSLREFIELKTKLQLTELQVQEAYKRLESANYKIGYLEARLEVSHDQIKLLTDSRINKPWWRRWRQWFTTVNP